MSVRYRPVQWTRFKLAYDALVLTLVALYVLTFEAISRSMFRGGRALSEPILSMRAWGSCAFFLLSLILCIGPLARLDRRFLPLLYNRRHLGVTMCAVACVHANEVLGFYFAWGKESPWLALLHYDTAFTKSSLPFIAFGVGALSIVLLLAVTSHDFWQKFFGGTAWKSVHMAIYVAYTLAVLHVAFGALQREANPVFATLASILALGVAALHVAASRVSADADLDGDWIELADIDRLPEGHARSVCPREGERIAIVRKADHLYAVHGVCAHQRGPLGEGRMIDGCLTCPWHGWQYRVEDGRSPPPFEEVIPTYRLRRRDGAVQLDPRALPLGSTPEPLPVVRSAS